MDKRRRREIFVEQVPVYKFRSVRSDIGGICRSYGACEFLVGQNYKAAAPTVLQRSDCAFLSSKPFI